MSRISDEQLIAEYLAGNDKSFELLIQNNLGAVYNFIYRYAQKADEAEDLAQEVFIKIWKNIRKFNANYKFRTWAFSIAKNTCLDFLKKKNRPMPFSELENDQDDIAFAETLADKSPSVLEALERQEGIRELNFAIEKLPADYRQTLALRHEEDLKFREIAELLKEPLDTVKTRYRRAVEALKKFF